ncbi:MAG: XRE family transcriptional regulator [Pseudomonadota bacterium]
MDPKKTFENRATETGEYAHSECQNCNEELFFAMRDNYHNFSIGLRTVLQCLHLAEEEGNVPKLPQEWWNQIANRHNIEFLKKRKRE